MPLEQDDQDRVDRAKEEVGADKTGTRLLVLNALESQKLGFWTVIGTVINRSIGSGIFVTPAIVLKATGSPGASLLLWAFGAITGMCALLVWLQFALSVPKFMLQNRRDDGSLAEGESLQSVPRSGGEKNFLEYTYGSTRLRKIRTTCMYGVIYVILGNLAGNTIAFGTYCLEAAGISDGGDGLIRGLAVVCMTSACLLHASYRQGGIYAINAIAIFKVCILVAIIIIGFAAMTGRSFGYGTAHGETFVASDAITSGPSNLAASSSFAFAKKDFASYANSILFVFYTYSGNEQPFYVMSEVKRPKKIFAKACITAVSIIIVLFMLVNIVYLGVVSYDPELTIQCLSIKDSVDKFDTSMLRSAIKNPASIEDKCNLDMATVFFSAIFGPGLASRVMAGIIATSIFGNVIVMTFTASRVKQEIAKEGVIPFWRFFSKNVTTPWARLRQRFWPEEGYEPEQSPAPALLLHWVFSVVLLGATAGRSADVAYQILVSLYSYTIVILIGFFTAGGLLYVYYFGEDGKWVERSGFTWGGPVPAIIYASSCGFLIVAGFVPPGEGSPFFTDIKWYIVPAIGLGFLVLGYVYYLGLMHLVPRFFKKNKVLVADRDAIIVREHKEYVMFLEIVDASWEVRSGLENDSDVEMHTVQVVE